MLAVLLFFFNFSSADLNKDSVTKAERWLFVGDSLTEGYGISKENAFPNLLEKKINNYLKETKQTRRIKVINAGVSGSTSASGLSRLKWHMKQKTNVVVIALGANDGLRALPTQDLERNLHQMVRYAKEHKAKVLLAGMKVPQNYGSDYAMAFEKAFRKVADQNDVVYVPFLLEGVAGAKDYNLSDGLHPNEKGHEVIANKLFPVLKEFL